jgi:hypothetical protein
MEGQGDLPKPVSSERMSIDAKEAGIKLGEAQGVIDRHLDQGFFGKEGDERYEQAKKASSYKGTGGDSTQENSDQIFAMRDSVKALVELDPQAKEIDRFLSDNLVVDVKEGDKTMRYSISEFEEKLEAIQNDSSLSEEQKKEKSEQLKQEARCGFLTEKKQVLATQEKPQEKSAEDIISQQLSSLEKQFEAIKKEGGRLTGEQQQLIDLLRLAKEANGEVGALLKEKALQSLKANGELGVDNTIEGLSKQVEVARSKLLEHLANNNWSQNEINEFRNLVDKGQLEKMIREGKFPNVEGLDVLLFGREMSEEKLKNLLDPEGKKGLKAGSLLLLLLVLALGSVELAKQAVPMQNQ